MKKNNLIKSNGNIKLGNRIGTISKLAGNGIFHVNDNGHEYDIQGSCGEFCSECGNRSGCYVFKSYRYGSVIKGHARTTKAFREDLDKAFKDMHDQLCRKRKPFEVVRVNQSGELESAAEFDNYRKLAKLHPETTFFFYTKAYKYVIDSLLTNGLPDNMVVLCSIWHEYGIKEYLQVRHIKNVKAFVYDDGFDYSKYGLQIETYCNAYDHNGKLNHEITCERCRKCYNKTCKVIGTFPH